MRGRFLASLGFAVMAALALFPWLLATAPLIGQGVSLGAFAVMITAAYAAVIAPAPALGLRAAALALLGGGLLWLLFPSPGFQSVGPLILLALIRSGWFFKRSPARAVLIEVLLAAVAIFTSLFLQGASLLSLALAVWGFWLVQSLYFLIADLQERPSEPHRDAFETAHEKALRLLEQTGP